MGLLLTLMPVASAMALHAVTQMASNGWRAFLWRRFIMKGILPGYLAGCLSVFLIFSLIAFTLPRAWVLLFLGLVPYLALSVPQKWAPDIEKKGAPIYLGALIMTLQLLAGVSGALLDIFFLRLERDRRQIVATKAFTQTLSHFFKLIYFTLVVPKPASSLEIPLWAYGAAVCLAILGTFCARFVLEKLTDRSFLRWSRILAMAMGAVFLLQSLHEFSHRLFG